MAQIFDPSYTMGMNHTGETDSTRAEQTISPSANWESRLGFFFGVLLLVLAGGSATFVGYKVKTAQATRRAEVMQAFKGLAGDPAALADASKAVPLREPNEPQQYFVAVYQLNEWVRTLGLHRSLQKLDPSVVASAIKGLRAMDATEAFGVTSETWALMHDSEELEPVALPPTNENNPTAARIARRYDRSFIRDVEAKLFHYLENHRKEIQAKNGS
jgi:hypothetical protein